jgi:hypothetical protein
LNVLTKALALVVCILASMHARADTQFAGSFSDHVTFAVNAGTVADVSVGYDWSDLLWYRGQQTNPTSHYFDAATLGWSLVRVNGAVTTTTKGTVTDSSNANSGSGKFSFDDLAQGTYTLTFTGTWAKPHLEGENWRQTAAVVNLQDATIAVTAVPEPESYAMLMAGLGLLGLAARRRTRK